MPLDPANEAINPKLRRMEEEFDSREDLSEDDSPPTDASEDSVEVRVTPITKPPKSHYTTRLPHKFRKALTQQHLLERSPSPPQSLVPASTFSTNLNHFENTYNLSSPLAGVNISPKTSHAALTQAPLSPGASARARANRRKAAEPRKVCAEPEARHKRAHDDEDDRDSSPKLKIQKIGFKEEDKLELPQPHAFVNHGALIAPLIPPGTFPHLLIPPWPPVVRHPYARLVGNVLAPPFGLLPASLPHSPYPLIPIVPPSSSHPVPTFHQHISSGESSTEVATSSSQDKPIPLVAKETKPSSHSNRERLKEPKSSLAEPSITSRSSSCKNEKEVQPVSRSSKAPSKFLSVESLLASDPPPHPHPPPEVIKTESEIPLEETIQSLLQQPKQKQRNYKNMTRERRIEANARERTRVHTISAAFEKLRRAVPSYSHNQKLSKLSVLRIACSYILSLSRLSGRDYSLGETDPSFEECVDLTTKTIQVEGKAKKKREDTV